jgi:hypothetical protein
VNDETHAYWLAYIQHIAELIQLKDWRFTLERTRPESMTSDAQIYLCYGMRRGDISVPPQFFALQATEQRYLIAHELIHAHLEDLDEHVRLYTNTQSDNEYFQAAYKREREIVVDTFALAIAPFLPLPEATS